MTTAQEYKKLHTKDIKVTSGATFTIRKIPKSLFFDVEELLEKIRVIVKDKQIPDLKTLNTEDSEQMKTIAENFSREQLKAYDDLYNKILPTCIVAPKVVFGKDPNEDELSVEDIDIKDINDLITGIFDLSKATTEAEIERKNLQPPP